MPVESIYAEAFLDARLSGDAALVGASGLNATEEFPQIYRNRAKQGSPHPFLVYNIQASHDHNSANKTRLFCEYIYQARIVGEVQGIDLQSPSRVRTSAHRMDALLSSIRRQTFTVSGVTYSFNSWRKLELPNREEKGLTPDISYWNFGAFYCLQVFKSSN